MAGAAAAMAGAATLLPTRPWHIALGSAAAGLALATGPPAGPLVAACAAFALLAACRAAALGALAAALVLAGAAAGDARLRALDRLSGLIRDGRTVELRAHLLTPRRPSPFGSTVEVEVAGGRLRGARLLVRVPRWARLPAGARIGDELAVRGRLRRPRSPPAGDFDFAAHLRRRGIAGELLLERVDATGARRGGAVGLLDRMRTRARRAVAAGLPPPEAALARGMVLGEDEAIAPSAREDFRDSGLAHLLAVSGQNVMLLVALAMPLLALAGLGPRARGVALLGLVAVYVPLAGAGPSLQRAGVMGAAGIAAMTLSRPSSRWYALLLAAAATLALNPRAWEDPGWQLSFAAVIGILTVGVPLSRALGQAAVGLQGRSPREGAAPTPAQRPPAASAGHQPAAAAGVFDDLFAHRASFSSRTPPVHAAPAPPSEPVLPAAAPVFRAAAPVFRAAPLRAALARGAAEGAAITIAAGLATAPLLAHHFGSVPLAGLLANLFALPAVAPAMWLGMVKAGLGLVAPALPPADWLAGALGPLTRLPVGYLGRLAEVCADLPHGQIGLPLGSQGGIAVAYLVLGLAAVAVRHACRRLAPRGHELAAAWRRRPRAQRAAAAAAALGAIGLLAATRFGPAPPPEALTVRFLDVGQGDATLIQHPDGSAVLFDAGPPEAGIARLLRKAGVRRLTVVVATHASRDHHGGMLDVLDRLEVGLLVDGGDGAADPGFRAVLDAARERVRTVPARAPMTLRAGGLTIRILSPPPRPPGPAPEDPNPRAVVAVVSAGSFDLLLSADAESEALLPLDLPDVEAMKVPHHGSSDPGLPQVLERVRPQLAAIEVGPNTYGHPAPSTLAALERAGARVYRTDKDGTITLTVAGDRIRVETEG
jgi:competence protein ComEC